MAFHETYQVYNRQNKQFVKMRNGKILDNSYFKFDDIPLFGGGPGPDDPEPAEAKKQAQKDDKPAENSSENDEDDGGVFMPLFG